MKPLIKPSLAAGAGIGGEPFLEVISRPISSEDDYLLGKAANGDKDDGRRTKRITPMPY